MCFYCILVTLAEISENRSIFGSIEINLRILVSILNYIDSKCSDCSGIGSNYNIATFGHYQYRVTITTTTATQKIDLIKQ